MSGNNVVIRGRWIGPFRSTEARDGKLNLGTNDRGGASGLIGGLAKKPSGRLIRSTDPRKG
jgi:hypothetical protein